jgi:DNA-binding CsgD family transcriptional regulator
MMLEEQFIEHMRSMNPRAKAGNPCAYPRERPSRSRPLHLPLGQCALPIVTDEEVKKQLHTLSEREYDTLRRFAQGQSCADIAADLGLSIKTVASYRARLLGKLQHQPPDPLCREA